ncbi:hypothetical protein [Paenibacillus auburnensis]|nr:hypothetical protein [Paenibacillus auburnensis]
MSLKLENSKLYNLKNGRRTSRTPWFIGVRDFFCAEEGSGTEYEVSDWRGRPYFVDLVWKPGQVKFAIEIKGYGPHVQHTDRTRYRQELNRETYLQIAGYRVVSVPYDDLESAPELTVSLFKSLLIPCLLQHAEVNRVSTQGWKERFCD